MFEFIDWVIQLNSEEEDRLRGEIKNLEEVKKMPYITSIERIGMEKGLKQGRQLWVIEELTERFGEVPPPISSAIHQIEDPDQLRALMRQAIISASLEEFLGALNGGNS